MSGARFQSETISPRALQTFKVTQEKFQREREAYFAATLEKIRQEPRMPSPLERSVG
jgi:hypothetical protein